MFPLKVQRGAVRRGLSAPQAAPGPPKAGGAARKEGGRRRASERAGAGRRPRRPPARQQEAEEGWGRRARPPPQDAATMDGGPDPSRPRAGCGAGQPGGAREAAVAWRSALAPAAAAAAACPTSRTALLGPGLRSPALLAAVETMEGSRAQAPPAPPPPPHPRRVNPFAAPAAPGC